MIEARNLVKTFTRQIDKKKKEDFNAVDGMNLKINDGELVGILGPNGAGKTTLLRMLTSLMTPTSGTITMTANGEELKTPLDIRKNIGYLSANTKLYERFSVREILRLFGETYGMTDEDIDKRTGMLVKALDMADFIDNRVAKLSTGQMQRTQIARCLIHDPDIYIFDEPTLGLDVFSASAIIDFMVLEKERGKTILYSTHYMEEAQYLCDRVYLLNKGKVVKNASPQALMEETGCDTMRSAFFASIGEVNENE